MLKTQYHNIFIYAVNFKIKFCHAMSCRIATTKRNVILSFVCAILDRF